MPTMLVVHKPADLVAIRRRAMNFPAHQPGRGLFQPATSSRQPATASCPPLDRETSASCSFLQKIRPSHASWENLGNPRRAKEYRAIVHGQVAAEQGIIDAPLGRTRPA